MRWQRGIQLFAYELLSGLLWLPALLVALVLAAVLPSSAGWLADVERGRAHRLGELPSGPSRAPDETLRAWLDRRRRSGALLRQDVAMFAALQVMGLPSMLLSAMFVLLAVFVPLQAVLDVQAVHVRVGGKDLPALLSVGMLVAAAALVSVGLRGLASVRLRVVHAFSRSREEELVEQVGRLSSGRTTLVAAFEAERRRIERDLHDGAQQQLVALSIELGRARLALRVPGADGRARTATALDAAQDRADAALAALRDTVRRVHPTVVAERGLFAGVEDLAANCGLPTTLALSGDDSPVASPCAVAAYFAVAEALTNTARHSGAGTASVAVEVTQEVQVTVVDTGRGGADPSRGTGLAGMQERVETIGGRLTLTSPPDGGTTLHVVLPLVPAWGAPVESVPARDGAGRRVG